MTTKTPITTPDGCASTLDCWRALTAMAELLESKARDLLTGDARIGISAGREAANVAVRARRAAAEIALASEQVQHSEWLMSEYKKLEGGGGNQRPRLKRRNP